MSVSEGSILQNANDVTIYGAHLTTARTINHQYVTVNQGSEPLQKLQSYVVSGALIDSAERYDPPKCHPDTRVAVLEKIERWSKGAGSLSVLWLCGAAGAGKSAIAQTIGEQLRKHGMLGASFFFSRTVAGRNEKKFFLATLAYQLALSTASPAFSKSIESAISKDPKVFEKSLEVQITHLVVNPLKAALTEGGSFPPVIVIDGLDECTQDYPHQDHEQQQQEILEAIATITKHDLPLRFLIASRPDRQLRESFKQQSLRLITSHIILDHSHNPDADIDLFLRCKFDELKEKNTFLDAAWPSEEIISLLVEKSSGHFVYASTVMRYIGHPRADPERSLENVLKVRTTDDQSRRPFAELDALYLHILQSVFTPSLPAVLDILGLLWHPGFLQQEEPFEGIKARSPEFMAKMLFTTTHQIYTDLLDLHSILEIPPTSAAKTTPITQIHASFSEFLLQPERSGSFYVDGVQVHLRSQRNLMKHAIIENSLHPSSSGYRRRNVVTMFLLGLERTPFNQPCPPSQELKEGLEAIMSSRDSKYGRYLESIGMAYLGRSRRRQFRRSLDWSTLLDVLWYLKCCNIPEVEPSWVRRMVTEIRLCSQLFLIYAWLSFIMLLGLVGEYLGEVAIWILSPVAWVLEHPCDAFAILILTSYLLGPWIYIAYEIYHGCIPVDIPPNCPDPKRFLPLNLVF